MHVTLFDKEIEKILNDEKNLVMEEPKSIDLPKQGEQCSFLLRGESQAYIFYIVRKGYRQEQFSLLMNLYQNEQWNTRIIRFDLYGVGHTNKGIDRTHPYYNKHILNPHVHIATQVDDQARMVCYPLNENYAKMYIKKEELRDYGVVIRKFLAYCKVTNLDELVIQMEEEVT